MQYIYQFIYQSLNKFCYIFLLLSLYIHLKMPISNRNIKSLRKARLECTSLQKNFYIDINSDQI